MDVKEMARKGGLASAKKRFSGLSKSQISRKMKELRYSKKTINMIDNAGDRIVENLNKNV